MISKPTVFILGVGASACRSSRFRTKFREALELSRDLLLAI
jgi:hypothetical protein